jgi:prepilin-type N-terminal cleavage/methylation domain-containing protein
MESLARSPLRLSGSNRRGFTLIEIMIVVGIMAVVLTMGVPIVYRLVNKEPMRKAISDIVEVCSEARRRAILSGAETKLVFFSDGRIEVTGGGGGSAGAPASSADEIGNAGGANIPTAPGGAGSVRLADNIAYELLTVDHIDYRDRESMSVSFRPNGTCDEMILILLSDKNERAKIWLEVTTSLSFVETDPNKFGNH